MNNDKAKAEILDWCSQRVECLARRKVLDLVGTLDAAQTSPESADHYSNSQIADRMQQTYDVTGDRWFKIAADRLRSQARKWDEGEHEGCGIDSQRALERQSRDHAPTGQQQTALAALVEFKRWCRTDISLKAWDALRALEAALSDTSTDRTCDHDWKVWPETNGQSQRCMKCGAYRDTPVSPPVREGK